MRNLNVASAIIIRDGKILLGERNYDDIGPVWVIPGGRLEDGETHEEGLRREVYEEIGVKELTILKDLGEFPGVFDDEQGRDVLRVYLVTTKEEPILMEPEKFSEWKWFAYNELPENLPDPERDRELVTRAFNDIQAYEG